MDKDIQSYQNGRLLIPWMYMVMSLKFLEVNSHGRLIEPPSRASMWRYGFNTPPNYNDHELYCGGFTKQWQINGGKCGVCGDPWDAPQPRAHEAGGKYGQGIIVRKYKPGSTFTIRVEVTANHRGHFEFKLCPNNSPKRVVTQQCLDKYVLKRARLMMKDNDEIFHETRYYPGIENKVYEMKYVLPPGLTCSQCVLQWRYIAGNNWGMCPNGTGVVGCGPQEEFRACADVSIQDGDGTTDDKSNTPKFVFPTSTTTTKTSTSEETTPNEHDNEISDDEEISEEFKKAEQRRNEEYFLFMSSIVAFSFILVICLFVLLYIYYYHAGEHIQKWWSKGGFGLNRVNRWSAFKNNVRNVCSRIKRPDNKKCQKVDCQNCPIPPPRVKKNSIGFKGVPENLV